MKLRVLGSSGSELPGFNSPGFLIDDTLLVDAGTIGAVLDEAAQWKIKHILITHAHLDHIKGIPFLADNIIVNNRSHTVTVSGLPAVLKTLKTSLLNGKVWPDFTRIPNPENPVLRLSPVKPEKTVNINGFKVTAIPVSHGVPAAGYIIEDKAGKRLLYTGDTGPTLKIWKAAERPLDCAIIEVSFPNSMKDLALLTYHLTPELLKAEVGKMKNRPDMLLVTHPKPPYLKRIKSELSKTGLKNIRVLLAGDVYKI